MGFDAAEGGGGVVTSSKRWPLSLILLKIRSY